MTKLNISNKKYNIIVCMYVNTTAPRYVKLPKTKCCWEENSKLYTVQQTTVPGAETNYVLSLVASSAISQRCVVVLAGQAATRQLFYRHLCLKHNPFLPFNGKIQYVKATQSTSK